MKFSENTNRHLSISQPIAGVSPNGSTNVSKEYLSILDATIAKYYPTNKEDILDKLKSKHREIKSKHKKINGKFYGSFVHKVLTLHPLRLELVNYHKLHTLINLTPVSEQLKNLALRAIYLHLAFLMLSIYLIVITGDQMKLVMIINCFWKNLAKIFRLSFWIVLLS